jgi:hypothetical protein
MSAHLKYRNRPTGGYASAKEARRAADLKLLAKAGKIGALREQVPYILIPSQVHPQTLAHQERACKYVADFVYEDALTGEQIVEDAKGMRTPEYVIKRKLMLMVHGIVIREV